MPPQEILSKDSVTVAVDAVVYYRIQVIGFYARVCYSVNGRFFPVAEPDGGRVQRERRGQVHAAAGLDHAEERAGNQEPERDPVRQGEHGGGHTQAARRGHGSVGNKGVYKTS